VNNLIPQGDSSLYVYISCIIILQLTWTGVSPKNILIVCCDASRVWFTFIQRRFLKTFTQ